jgi:NAD/NADP transhydrogenase beta subunit
LILGDGDRRGHRASGQARRVEMTGMPELIAMLHSFVGLAAVLVGWNSFYGPKAAYHGIHMGSRSSPECSSVR